MFIGQALVRELIKHLPGGERENIAEIKAEIAGARRALKELFIKHNELIKQTPLAEIRGPLLELLSDAERFLDLKNSDLTLGDLSASRLGAQNTRRAARFGRGDAAPFERRGERRGGPGVAETARDARAALGRVKGRHRAAAKIEPDTGESRSLVRHDHAKLRGALHAKHEELRPGHQLRRCRVAQRKSLRHLPRDFGKRIEAGPDRPVERADRVETARTAGGR